MFSLCNTWGCDVGWRIKSRRACSFHAGVSILGLGVCVCVCVILNVYRLADTTCSVRVVFFPSRVCVRVCGRVCGLVCSIETTAGLSTGADMKVKSKGPFTLRTRTITVNIPFEE